MKLAIMQPYFFPYIGYFQLVHAVDLFVFYDTVQFIKKGWINRNRILVDGKGHLFTIPLRKDSQTKAIDQREVAVERWRVEREKLLTRIQRSYAKAPHFQDVFPWVEQCILLETSSLSAMVRHSIVSVMEYLDIETDVMSSSAVCIDHALAGQDKILAMCESLGATQYINASGGVDLYDREAFVRNGLTLSFIKPTMIEYRQFEHEFIPGLSVIDVMMFNSRDKIRHMLAMYELM